MRQLERGTARAIAPKGRQDPMAMTQTSFDRDALLACARGELFGPGNAQLPERPSPRGDHNYYVPLYAGYQALPTAARPTAVHAARPRSGSGWTVYTLHGRKMAVVGPAPDSQRGPCVSGLAAGAYMVENGSGAMKLVYRERRIY